MPPSIRSIIVTPDLERLRTFYLSLLGAEEIVRLPDEGPPFYVGLRFGDSELGVTADSAVTAGEPGRLLLSIEVPDVDAALATVEQLGGSAPGPSHDMPWGQRVAHIRDPDGNIVNLTQPL
jgi:predicted enzyme related to lactoylglutathione lyase